MNLMQQELIQLNNFVYRVLCQAEWGYPVLACYLSDNTDCISRGTWVPGTTSGGWLLSSVVSWTGYRQMWKPQSKAGAEPQLGWTKVYPSAVWADNHLDIVSGCISLCPASVVWQWGQATFMQVWRGRGAAAAGGCRSAPRHTVQQQPQGSAAALGISCPSQPGCYLASQQFEEHRSWDAAAWRCSLKRGKPPQHLGHSCIYTAQKANKEKCSGVQSFSTQPLRILKRRRDKPPRASFPLQLLSNLFSCLFKCSALGNWGSISQGI